MKAIPVLSAECLGWHLLRHLRPAPSAVAAESGGAGDQGTSDARDDQPRPAAHQGGARPTRAARRAERWRGRDEQPAIPLTSLRELRH